MKNQRNKILTFLVVFAIVFGYHYFFEGEHSAGQQNSQLQTSSIPIQTTAFTESKNEIEPGTSAQIEQPKTIEELVSAGILTEVKDDDEVIGWSTKGDLFYGMGSKHGNRIYHIFAHLEEDPSKPVHSVFLGNEAELLALLDEAWSQRDEAFTKAQSNGNRVYDIDMDRTIGTDGEEQIRIVVRDGTNSVISAYPRD